VWRTSLIQIETEEDAMRDYLPLHSNHNLPDPEPEEDQEAQQPIVVDFVYNTHEIEGKSKTIAIKVSLQLPLQ
jgi:hypothetical protein